MGINKKICQLSIDYIDNDETNAVVNALVFANNHNRFISETSFESVTAARIFDEIVIIEGEELLENLQVVGDKKFAEMFPDFGKKHTCSESSLGPENSDDELAYGWMDDGHQTGCISKTAKTTILKLLDSGELNFCSEHNSMLESFKVVEDLKMEEIIAKLNSGEPCPFNEGGEVMKLGDDGKLEDA